MCKKHLSYNKKKAFRVSSLLGSSVENNKLLAASIDIIAILTTITGIATSLGLGASQISGGLDYVFGIDISEIPIIIFITILGLISVSLGLDKGIKRLSQINMIIAGFLLIIVLVKLDQVYLNVLKEL